MSDWIKQLPKIELHCHLDGSVRPQTIVELAAAEGRDLNVHHVSSFMRVPLSCSSLMEYLERFDLPLTYMNTPEALTRISREVAEDAALDNVKYMEIRFAPHLHTSAGMTVDEVIESVGRGLTAAQEILDIQVRMIIICMRNHATELNMAVVEAAHRFMGRGVVGVDLAGDEAQYPPEKFATVFQLANELGLPITIHAGEAGGANNIITAVEQLHATRIGHGVRLKESERVKTFVREHGITLEMCVTSNVHTKAVLDIAAHPITEFLQEGIAVTVNTDNRTVSDTNLTKEYMLLQDRLHFKPADFKTIAKQAIHSSFAEEELKQQLLQKFLGEWDELGVHTE